MTAGVRWKTFVFFWTVVTAGFSAERPEICLQPQAHVRGSIVLLGDVAEVRDSDPQRAATLKRLELFPAPVPGQPRTLRAGEVQELLQLNGFPAGTCGLSGVRLARVYSQPKTATPVAASAPPKPVARKPERDNPPQEMQPFVVVRRALGPGEVIRPLDVELRTDAAAPRGVLPIHRLDDALGLEVTRLVSAGQPLDQRLLKRPILIRRGEMIVVYARAAGVTVRSSAKALDEASQGDLVTLEALENRQRFWARVTGLRQADVYASGSPADSPPSPFTSPAADVALQKSGGGSMDK